MSTSSQRVFDECRACEGEATRVERHLEGALRVVERAPVRGLTPDRAQRRARLVTALKSYARGRRFPKNDHSIDRAMPTFVDAHGIRCAMAHLIERHGGAVLVSRVARSRNHATVFELAVDPELRAWLDAWGLGVAEAARIQPGYCWTAAHCTCKNLSKATTVYEVQLVAEDGGTTGRIVKIHGREQVERVGEAVPVRGSWRRSADGGTIAFLVVPYEVSVRDPLADGGVGKERRFEEKEVDGAGRVSCGTIGRGVPKAQAIRAILSPSCEASLQEVDPRFVTECQPFERSSSLEPVPSRDRELASTDDRAGSPLRSGALGFVTTAFGAALCLRRRRERARNAR